MFSIIVVAGRSAVGSVSGAGGTRSTSSKSTIYKIFASSSSPTTTTTREQRERRRWIGSLRGGGGGGGGEGEAGHTEKDPTTRSNMYRTVQVQAVHRHGDRTPITPLKDEKYWSSTLVSEELLRRVAAGTRVIRQDDDNVKLTAGTAAAAVNHAAGGRGPFGKLTQMGLFQMVQVGEQLKIDLEQHTTWKPPASTAVSSSTLTGADRGTDIAVTTLRPQDIRVYSTDFPRTIQSVQGVLVGILPSIDDNTVDVDIDCCHTISWMIPDPQPRRTKEQERLEMELSHRPHMLEREAEMRPLAVRCTKALQPLLGDGAFNMAFGVGEDNTKNNDDNGDDSAGGDHIRVLPWAQLAEITKCLEVRGMLPPEITVEDQEAVSAHTAWKWFESLRHPRLAFLSMHIFTNKIVESFQDAIASCNEPKLILYSCHDSSLIGLLCAFHLEQPTKWPEYGSVLKIELLEKRTAVLMPESLDDSEQQTTSEPHQMDYVVRFYLNGELLRSMWHGTLRDEINLDQLQEFVTTIGASTASTTPSSVHTTPHIDTRGGSAAVAIESTPVESNSIDITDNCHSGRVTTSPPSAWKQAQSVPNIITLTRMASTPLLCYWIVHGDYNLALYGLVVAAFSDGLDGFLAKHHGGGTILGTYLDPLADKVLVNGLGVSLWYAGILPTPLVAVWALKDVILLGGMGWYLYQEQHTINFLSNSVATKPLTVTPTLLGKVNTGLQFATLSIGILAPVLGSDVISPDLFSKLCWVTGISTVASLLSYTGRSGFKMAQSSSDRKQQKNVP